MARHAGRKHAIAATIAITTKAVPNASGSRGLTWNALITPGQCRVMTAPITIPVDEPREERRLAEAARRCHAFPSLEALRGVCITA
jgi:hypothetical protein